MSFVAFGYAFHLADLFAVRHDAIYCHNWKRNFQGFDMGLRGDMRGPGIFARLYSDWHL
jgi:hypothetical protein